MYVSVRVVAGAKHEAVEQLAKDRLKITVREKAERNLANKRALELVAAQYKVSTKNVRLINGHHSPAKLFALPD